MGVVVTSWVMTRKSVEKQEEDCTPTEEKVEKEGRGDPMEVDDASFGDDPPTEEEGEVKQPDFLVEESPGTQGSTEYYPPPPGWGKPIFTPEEMADMAEKLAPAKEQKISIALRSGMGSKSPHCVGTWQQRGEGKEDRRPCDECGVFPIPKELGCLDPFFGVWNLHLIFGGNQLYSSGGHSSYSILFRFEFWLSTTQKTFRIFVAGIASSVF